MARIEKYGLALGLGLAFTSTALFTTEVDAQDWKPQKPVEFVIMAGAGGGADQIARLIQNIVQKNDLSNVPFIPVNKGGGSGAEGLRYLADKSGDCHTIMVSLNSFFTTPLRQGRLGVDPRAFTPIAMMAVDPFVLWVRSESDVETLDQWIAEVKEAGSDYVVGGTGNGQEDSLVFTMLRTTLGLPDFTYVPYEGGGDVAKNLIGGHITATVNNPAEQTGFYQAGMSRPIMVIASERLSAYPDTPSAAELGYEDLEYFQYRFIVGPPEMPKECQNYYTEVMRQVNDSEEWVKYTKEQSLERNFLSQEKLAQFISRQYDVHADMLTAMGEEVHKAEAQ
jgi:tripartite-type tricarboxylate transporter receptor subunit TctC